MAALKYLKTKDRETFENRDAVKAAINAYRHAIVQLNRENMRCSALELVDFKPGDAEGDVVIFVEGVIYLTFYASQTEQTQGKVV